MTRSQDFRISQLILTFGPGALIETVNGPRLLPLPEFGLFSKVDPDKYSIEAPHLYKLLGGARIFRLPSTAELGITSKEPIYRTRAFPTWKLCVTHSVLYRDACPACTGAGQRSKQRGQTIRFLLACSDGHLDEVPWSSLVHPETDGRCPKTDTEGKVFDWQVKGSTLRDVRIKCISKGCNAQATLADAYEREWSCSGRYPEREPLMSRAPSASDPLISCDKTARVMQRQATSLRLPEVISALTIPPLEAREHQLLNRSYVRISILSSLRTSGLWDQSTQSLIDPTPQQMSEVLKGLEGPDTGITPADLKYLRNRLTEDPVEFIQKVRDVYCHKPVGDIKTLMRDEFRALIQGAREGIPSSLRNSRGHTLLEIKPHMVREVASPMGQLTFRVAPVQRLHSVLVQHGYRRAVASSEDEQPLGRVVSIKSQFNGFSWYPGHESTGEGIFITLAAPHWHPHLPGPSAHTWLDAWQHSCDSDHTLNTLGRDVQHPVFVWWHTLSHLIMRTLAIDSGYNLASIRERIYIDTEQDGNQVRGGILLYTSGYGSDASLGGLIAMVPRFERILKRAFAMSETCSADPLCEENRFVAGQHSGAACYACSLVSETSCEHRKLWLDRNIMTEANS